MKFKKIYANLFLCAILFFSQNLFAQVPDATMQQIQLLLNEKNNRTPIERKIDSRLLQALKESRGEKLVQGLNLEKADVGTDAFGVLKVDISANITDAFLSKLTSLGGKIIYASSRYSTVRATINLKAVETIAAYSEVKFVQPAVKDMLEDGDINDLQQANNYADRIAVVKANFIKYLNQMKPLVGKVTSQGDVTHRANDVRSTYGYQGQGIRVGVLSNSYNAKNKASADIASGDLPGPGNPDGDTIPVTVLADFPGGSDEGRAMLQVIHDLAPKAQLFFATADISEASFADNIRALRDSFHCNVIVDDVFYYDEPVFQDGIVAQAVNYVTSNGALYFASAGNAGSVAKGTAGVFEGDFNDAGSLPFTGGTKTGTIHNFGTVSTPVNGDIIKTSGLAYTMNWSDPWGASSNDYDLFLVSASGTVKSSSTNIQSGSGNPYEQIAAPNLVNGDRLVVFKTASAAVRAFHINTNRGVLTVVTGGQTKGHSCALNAFAMAATPAATAFQSGAPVGPYPNPFNSSNKVENFSSDGPRRKFYNPDGTPITPGNVLFGTGGGVLLAKPDLTAADGVKTTFSALSGLSPFFGTSCAAPHGAAIAALILSANPSLTTTQVRNILTSTALDIESAGYDYNSGYGIIQAFQAASAVPLNCNSTYDGTTHNTFATAVSIPFNTDVHGTISSGTDSDFYKFTITTKGTATVSLTTLPANYDLYIYNNAHTQVAASKKAGTTSEVISKSFAKGNFYVKVVGRNKNMFDSVDCYTLNVTLGTATKNAEDIKINAPVSNNGITVFPNPATSFLNINIDNYKAGMKVAIANVYGVTVLSQNLTSVQLKLNLSAIPSGTYLLNVVDKDGNVTATSKFIKQ